MRRKLRKLVRLWRWLKKQYIAQCEWEAQFAPFQRYDW